MLRTARQDRVADRVIAAFEDVLRSWREGLPNRPDLLRADIDASTRVLMADGVSPLEALSSVLRADFIETLERARVRVERHGFSRPLSQLSTASEARISTACLAAYMDDLGAWAKDSYGFGVNDWRDAFPQPVLIAG